MNTTNSSKRKTVLAGLVGLFAAGGMTQTIAQGGEAATGQGRIDEIIVTANKREQSLQDTALSISALTSDTIDKKGLVSMADYLNTIPGVNQVDRGPGRNTIVIRGISSDPTFEDATAGVYFGEASLTNLLIFGSPDLKLVDMERVEVIRGPQGTLYGAASLTGTVRNIPKAPKFDEIEGALDIGLTSVDNGGHGSKAVGTINIPLIEDQLALRASAYRFENGGYIKNIAGSNAGTSAVAASFGAPEIAQDQNDVGKSEYIGGRIAIAWTPSEDLSLTLNYIDQDLDQTGSPDIFLNLGKYEQARFQLLDPINSSEGLAEEMDVTNLVIEYDLGWSSILSSSSWIDGYFLQNLDMSILVGNSFPLPQFAEGSSESFAQEMRIASKLDGPLQFVAGLYYSDVELNRDQDAFYGGDPLLSPIGGILAFDFDGFEKTEQKSFFGEITYDFIPEIFTATFGARFYDYDLHTVESTAGPFAGAGGFSDLTSSEDGTSHKLNLTYSPNDDVLMYIQWSEGFRLGNNQLPIPESLCDLNNDGILDGTNAPIDTDSYDPDTLENFELGTKFSGMDGRISISAAVYRMNWDGIPVEVVGDCNLGPVLNAGEAETQGVEIEASMYVNESLRIDINGSYVDSELTKDAPALDALSGARLPGAPRYNISLALQYDFKLLGRPAFSQADYSRLGTFFSNLQEAGTEAGGYALLNAKLGLNIDNITLSIYGRNLANSDEIAFAGSIETFNTRVYPRTLGLGFNYQF